MAKILKAKEMNKCLGCFTCMQMCAAINKKSHSLTKSAMRVRTIGGMTTRFIVICCHGCKTPACINVCLSGAMAKRKGGGVLVDSKKCIGCRSCEKACGAKAINFDNATKKPIICHHCGVCAKYCPHDCIQLVEGEVE